MALIEVREQSLVTVQKTLLVGGGWGWRLFKFHLQNLGTHPLMIDRIYALPI